MTCCIENLKGKNDIYRRRFEDNIKMNFKYGVKMWTGVPGSE